MFWSKELQFLRTFFEYCGKRRWCQENLAHDMDMPPDPKPRPREPYTAEEIAKIIAATDAFGKNQYERLRARAMILLMRYYGIRVSDVATLRRDRIRGNQIVLHALKNGAAIWLAALRRGRFALCAVSKPYGAKDNGPYVFWSGRGDVEEHKDCRTHSPSSVPEKRSIRRYLPSVPPHARNAASCTGSHF